jgi:hypothetical protein
MNVSPHTAAVTHGAAHQELNPSQQAKAADPAVKGADFGALVSQFAKAQHAPATEPTAPATDSTAA